MAVVEGPTRTRPWAVLWRLSLVFTDDATAQWYMVFLSALSMGLALLTLGLVHRWGQRVPHWVPGVGGRPIPARPVVRVALTAGWLLVAICVYFLLHHRFHLVQNGWVGIGEDEPVHLAPGWEVLRYYAPMLGWGPLVIAVAADYGRRAANVRRMEKP